MAELAPGVFVTPLLEPGTAYVVNMDARVGTHAADFGEQGRGLAIPEADWERIDAPERERILDTVTRDSAEAGLARLQGWLADK
jgi:hypothetical protein